MTTATLLLRLAGPLQAWGEDSRSVRRETENAPTKSGVLGLLAAAQGRRRTDPIEDLLSLDLAVRIEQPGRVERDFQTSRSMDGKHSFPLTTRYYLTDAVFLVAVQGDRAMLDGLDAAVRRPQFPLYLGRRSCPPTGEVTLGVHEASAFEVLTTHKWEAASWWKRQQGVLVDLELVVDESLLPDGTSLGSTTTHRDVPVSFDPRQRTYGWRSVAHQRVTVSNDVPEAAPSKRTEAPPRHDPMASFGGA